MTDLSDESLPEWTEEELGVLGSAAGDAPGPRSLAATLSAVGASGAVVTGTAAAKGAATVATPAKWSALLAAKWIGVVAVGSAVVAGGVVWVRHASSPGETTARAPAPATPVMTPEEPAATVPEEPVNPAVSPPPAGSDSPSAGLAPPARASAAPARSAVRPQSDITLEIGALDAARTALRAGRAGDALTALDRYDAAFARAGSLRVEATALRIEALVKSGRRAQATTLANAFLARNPKSPYAARVRTLVAAP